MSLTFINYMASMPHFFHFFLFSLSFPHSILLSTFYESLFSYLSLLPHLFYLIFSHHSIFSLYFLPIQFLHGHQKSMMQRFLLTSLHSTFSKTTMKTKPVLEAYSANDHLIDKKRNHHHTLTNYKLPHAAQFSSKSVHHLLS